MKTTTKTIILSGFGIILVLLVCLLLIWMRSVRLNSERLETIVDTQREQQLVFTMRDSAHKRALSLFRMAAMPDPFERDDEYLNFKRMASEFLVARDELLERHVQAAEHPVWSKVRPVIDRGGFVQNKALELMLDDRTADAYKVLHDEVIPTQVTVMNELTKMLEETRGTAHSELAIAREDNRTTYILVAALGGGALLIVCVIAVFVMNRTSQAEHALLDQSVRLRALYETTSMHGLTLEDQISTMLRRGCDLLGTESAHVNQIDQAANTCTCRFSHDVTGVLVEPGASIPLTDSLCSIPVASNQPIAISSVAASPYNSHAAHGISRRESYIGAPIRMKGEMFGTVSFSSRRPSVLPFDSRDVDLVNLIASWIGVTLERVAAQRELSIAKEAAESASRAKSAFVANMSHEIRTPLTAIVGFADVLIDPQHTPEEQSKAAMTIQRSSKHLGQVINDILDLSKIEAGQLSIERIPTAPFEVLSEVESLIGMQARDKGLAFGVNYHYPLPDRIITDPMRLKQILLNLCGNAVKFTERGRVSIDVFSEMPERRLRLLITDSGVGMTPEEVSRLFQAFAQADVSTTRRYGGTGLGLCISKEFAGRLGGTIICRSEKGRGSEFEVTVDIGGEEPQWVTQYPGLNENKPGALRVPRLAGDILLAEDSPEIQGLINMYVRRTGAKLTIVENGQLAVEHALQYDYDLVLLDMQMPVMDGLTAAGTLRRAGYRRPIVSLTANALREDRERCLASGADDYISKPVDLPRFYSILEKYVPARQGERVQAQGGADTELQADPEFQELVHRFKEGLPAMLLQINDAAAQQNWAGLRSVTHNLKGMGGGFGFPALSAAAAEVLDAVRSQNNTAVADAVATLRRKINAIQGAATPPQAA